MMGAREAVARTLDPGAFVGRRTVDVERRRSRALVMASEAVRAYEAHVTTMHLANLLVLRSPGKVVPTRPPAGERDAGGSCVTCGRPFEPGQAYVVDGPRHVRCA